MSIAINIEYEVSVYAQKGGLSIFKIKKEGWSNLLL